MQVMRHFSYLETCWASSIASAPRPGSGMTMGRSLDHRRTCAHEDRAGVGASKQRQRVRMGLVRVQDQQRYRPLSGCSNS